MSHMELGSQNCTSTATVDTAEMHKRAIITLQM